LSAERYFFSSSLVVAAYAQLPVPKTDQVQIFSFCKVCGKATPFIPMSEETWKYSFGKFLELTYYNEFVKTSSECCGHSPHKDHTRCFFSQNLVRQRALASPQSEGLAR